MTTTTQATTTPKPVVTTAQTEPPVDFDPQAYLDYAREYGVSIGLIFGWEAWEPIGNQGKDVKDHSSWDTPIVINATLDAELLRRGIRSRLDSMISGDYSYFWAELEKGSGGYYKLYIYR